MATQLRGSTQIMDLSVTYEKLAEGLQNLINRAWTRVDFEATAGQTLLTIPGLTSTDITEFYRNGVLLHGDEYTVNNGSISTSPLGGNEMITVFYDTLIDTNSLYGDALDGGTA